MENPQKLPEKAIENIKALEQKRNSPVVLIHSLKALTRTQANQLAEAIQNMKPVENIDVILNSLGGDIDAAYIIVNLLRSKTKKLTIIVPRFAKSAATLITLGADEILMPLSSELGPLDSMLQHPKESEKRISALDAFKTFEFIRNYLFESMDLAVQLFLQRGLNVSDAVTHALNLVSSICHPLYSQMDPLFMGESERTLLVAEEYGKRLLEIRKASLDKDKLINQIVRNYPSHTFVIDINEAKRLGLDPKPLPEDLLKVVNEVIKSIKTDKPIIYLSNSIQQTTEEEAEGREEQIEVVST